MSRQLRLNNNRNARASLARLIRDYVRDQGDRMTTESMRCITYAFSVLAQYYKQESDAELAELAARVAQLERAEFGVHGAA